MRWLDEPERTAVITGAAGGLGSALARELGGRGWGLELADVAPDRLETVATDVRAAAGAGLVRTRVIDVSDPDATRAFAADVRGTGRPVHLLFNNAGVNVSGWFHQLSDDDFDDLLAVNLLGTIRVTRAFLPLLLERPRAQIVNISSIFGIIAPPGYTAYCTAKFGMRGFGAALGSELAHTGVRVTTVYPGGLATGLAERTRRGQSVEPREHDRGIAESRRWLTLPPERAARSILKAVDARRTRVVVGRDARIAALIERIFPVRHLSVLSLLER